MANHSPNIVALRSHGRGRVFWVEQQFDHWGRCKIQGVKYTHLPIPDHPVFIDKREILRRTGLSYVSIWSMEKRDEFPPRVRLTPPARAEVSDAAD
jgi:hypothetical protein